MKYFYVVLLCFLVLTVVFAGAVGSSPTAALAPTKAIPPKDDSHVGLNPGTPDFREGGETIGDAFPIPDIPFIDTGNTCDNVHDYDVMCPYGSWSPDVVYSWVATSDMLLTIDLCSEGNQYDTKVFVYENSTSTMVGCNDDFCANSWTYYASRIDYVPMTTGNTYYIVVDGYGGDCGNYELSLFEDFQCPLECPPGALEEGEPELVDNYVDTWNSGCGGLPDPVFQAIGAQEDNCATMCAVSGWYDYYGLDYKDTDWFEVAASGSQIEWTVEAEYDVWQMVILPDCSNQEILIAEPVPFCLPNTVTFETNLGEVYWLFVAPQEFTGMVNEFDYIMTICGILEGPVLQESATWGCLKALYR
jgi:hypothetical protein